jgi:hypothetical protein
MNIKTIIILSLLGLLTSCSTYNTNQKRVVTKEESETALHINDPSYRR